MIHKDKVRKVDERRKFVNLFAGLDNTTLLPFGELKRATFKDIFSCRNDKAHSIKKTLNFLNYSNEVDDIITKKDRNPAYKDF